MVWVIIGSPWNHPGYQRLEDAISSLTVPGEVRELVGAAGEFWKVFGSNPWIFLTTCFF